MKRHRLYPAFLFCVILLMTGTNGNSQNQKYNDMVENIHWFGQAAIKIVAEGKTIYIDPYRLKEDDQADIVLITHCHADHLSPADIKKVITDKSILVIPENCK